MFDINPNDTLGLRIFGLATQINNDDTVALLGNKNGRLWVQMLAKSDHKYYKITNFIVNGIFHDNIEIDLGYGEKINKYINYIDWNESVNVNYFFCYHNQENFAISENRMSDKNDILSWIIYGNNISAKEVVYYDIIVDGYIGSCFVGDNWDDGKYTHWHNYICNEKGEPLYRYKDEFENYTFINLYEYIKYSNNSILRQNAETGKVIWENQLEKIGQVIDGHEPKIEHSIEIVGEYAECLFNITNYDGSKETQTYNVDIETGEIIEK